MQAADTIAASACGLARHIAARPASAANCRRRVCNIVNPEPSAKTAAVAGQRAARSIAHIRAAASGGSMNSE
ncbi:MAG: hypothetical protein KDA25_09790 [Phycisphaerales bacterium]|nr:hypothetical protein [Phycisphaerales bacterium]